MGAYLFFMPNLCLILLNYQRFACMNILMLYLTRQKSEQA
jgi:hypothetical protein